MERPRTRRELQQRRRRRQQGFTLIEIMIVVLIISLIAGGVSLALIPRLNEAKIKTARTDAQAMRSAITLYMADNPRDCPTVEELVEKKYLQKTGRTLDPWEGEFQIECESGDITVISAGPDLQFGTEDDVQ